FLRLLRVDDLLEVLDQADDVAHAEDARRETLGPELLELVERLAHAEELDRLAGDLLDRQRSATTRVAVELRHDHAVDVEALVERVGDVHLVLTGHRVEDEEDVRGRDRLVDVVELLHQGLVDRESAGGVEDDDVAALLHRRVDRLATDRDRILALGGVDRCAELAAERLQLLDGGG